MKRINTLLIALFAVLGVTNAQFTVICNQVGSIDKDTTIQITAFTNSMMQGLFQEVTGSIIANPAISMTVTATRNELGKKDDFCYIGTCVASNEELSQSYTFTTNEGLTSWYAHYKPTEAGEYTVSYTFDGGGKSITLTVEYNYNPTNLEQTYNNSQLYMVGNTLTWTLENAAPRTFLLHNLTGKAAETHHVTEASGSIQTNLSKGMYVLSVIENGKQTAVKKITIR